MVELARAKEGELISLSTLARKQGIPEKYLEQIISILSKSGYLNSVRGSQGGYSLKFAPSQYTVGMILRLTEGSLSVVDCLASDENPCKRQSGCSTLPLWTQLNNAINQVVDNYTLEELAK